MNQICQSLKPNLESVCINWFRFASEHCMNLILQPKSRGIWCIVKSYIFQEGDICAGGTDGTPINLQPANLTILDCETLLMEILNDYTVTAPRFAKESAMNNMLWQVLFSLIGVLALGHIVVVLIFLYNKYKKYNRNRRTTVFDTTKLPYKVEKRMRAVANRTLRLALCELRLLKVKRSIYIEELLIPDGSPVLVLCINSELQVIDNVLIRTLQGTSRLYRAQAEHITKQKAQFKRQSITKALDLVHRYPRKLRFVLLFDEAFSSEEFLRQHKETNLNVFGKPNYKKNANPVKPNLSQRTPRSTTNVSSKSHFTTRTFSHPPIPLNCSHAITNREILFRNIPGTNSNDSNENR